MTHEVASKAKTEALHRIQTYYLPLYFPKVDRFRKHWGMLTTGTGLGNARFISRAYGQRS